MRAGIAAWFLWIPLVAHPLARGDIVPAADGRRYRGVVVAASERWAVLATLPAMPTANPLDGLRIVRRSGGPIVFEPLPLASPPAGPTAGDAAAAIQIVREALLIVRDDRPRDALLALQRLVTTASPQALRAAEAWCRAHLRRDLARWIARLRLDVALDPDSPRVLKISYATPYEREALAALLRALLERRLSTGYGGRSVEAWAEAPEAYEALRPDAPELVRDARVAAAAIGALLRWDPRLGRRDLRRRALSQLRQRLMRLSARVEALPGYTELVARSRGVVPARGPATMPASTRPVP